MGEERSRQGAAATDTVLEDLAAQLGMSRRELLSRGGFSLAGLAAMATVGCKTTAATEVAAEATGERSFFAEIAAVEKNPISPTDPAFENLKLMRTLAISRVIGDWLGNRPFALIKQLLESPEPIFKPEYGPVIIFRHEHVLAALEMTDVITVEPYYAEMRMGTDGQYDYDKQSHSSHFILGTDDEKLYRPDGKLLRSVLTADDRESILRPLIRKSCEKWAKAGTDHSLDVAVTLARFVPVDIVDQYLGVPTFEEGEVCFDGKLKGGEKFPITEAYTESFEYNIPNGIIPTRQHMYDWVKAAFRNIFNNPKTQAKYTGFQAEGRRATQYLSAYIHKTLLHFQAEIKAGRQVPVNMLTRLLMMQDAVQEGGASLMKVEDATNMTQRELVAALKDGRIRSNVFGTVVGGVVNPEEGSARVVDAILRLKEGKYPSLGAGTSYARAVKAARDDSPADREVLRRFALEGLRLQPQGEVVLRISQAEVPNLRLASGNLPLPKPIAPKSVVFIAHAAAMRDATAVKDPLTFDIDRDQKEVPFTGTTGMDRPKEVQSQVYLQHGYGRHKCLGRYASELTMAETLRAVLLLGDIKRASPLRMDDEGLYANDLKITF